MIKVCSLDYLNKEIFETDIKTNDGRILVHSGEKISPGLILRLYFKEIYIEEALKVLDIKPDVLDYNQAEAGKEIIYTTPGEDEIEDVIQDNKLPPPPPIGLSIPEKELSEKGPRMIEVEEQIPTEEKGPKPAAPNFDFEEETSVSIKKETKEVKEIEEVPIEEPEDNHIKFDEEQAKRISAYSLIVGKLIGYSKEELKELEQTAYYYNIGISKFTKEDVKNKGFDKQKALEGYKKLTNELMMPDKIAEAVKYSANNYDSDSFSFDSKIPFHHIIAIAGYYEDLLSNGISKEAALLKMLQLGGNRFNIFVLHKFVNLIKESNE